MKFVLEIEKFQNFNIFHHFRKPTRWSLTRVWSSSEANIHRKLNFEKWWFPAETWLTVYRRLDIGQEYSQCSPWQVLIRKIVKCVKGLRVFWDAEKRETSRSECQHFAQESVNAEIRSCVERGNVRCIQAFMQGLIETLPKTKCEKPKTSLWSLCWRLEERSSFLEIKRPWIHRTGEHNSRQLPMRR